MSSQRSNEENKKEKREKFVIEIDHPHPFNGNAATKLVTSDRLTKMIAQVFRDVFEDFEGCIFEVTNSARPTISLIFNHGQYDKDAIVACTRASSSATGNKVVDSIRYRDSYNRNGDRYILTDDGKDAIMNLLAPEHYRNGNPNWKILVSEYVERTMMNQYNQFGTAVQYTKVSGLSLDRLCGLLYGSKEDGDRYEYQTFVGAPLNVGYANNMPYSSRYAIWITRVSSKEMNKTFEELGVTNYGSNIVR